MMRWLHFVFPTLGLAIGIVVQLLYSRRDLRAAPIEQDKGTLSRSIDYSPKLFKPPSFVQIDEQKFDSQNLIMSCKEMERMNFKTETTYFTRAIGNLCDNAEYADQVDTWVDPKFKDNYKKFYSKDGWLDEAYVAYFALPEHEAQKAVNILTQMTWLLRSVEQGSKRPIVAFNFGAVDVPWQPEEFPQAVVMRARPMNKRARFNFNKFRAMMLARVKTGIMLDADEFVGPAADRLFPRIKEEINEDYPYPILPVHWMSRDNDPKFPNHPYAVYDFKCQDCPERSQRWSHAHPTFTFHSLPFIASWLRKTLDHEKLGNEPLQGKEDEDVLNMGLWHAGATKQWCKFDAPFENEFFKYLGGGKGLDTYADPKWYPEGIPLVFYTAHHAVNFDETLKILSELKERSSDTPEMSSLLQKKNATDTIPRVSDQALLATLHGKELPMETIPHIPSSFPEMTEKKAWKLPPPILYRGKYYNDGKELKADHPDLRCII